MLLPLFISSVFSITTVAIDIGTESFKARTLINGRETRSTDYPAYFAIWNYTDPTFMKNDTQWTIDDLNESQWLFFNKAKNLLTTNLSQFVVRGFNPLTGSTRGIPNRIIFTAMLKEIYSQQSSYHPNNPLIFTVPASMSRKDRYILQEAADLLSLNLVAVVDQHAAMASRFLEVNKTTFKETSRNVMFLDVGAKETWYTIYNFSSDQINITHIDESDGSEYNETIYTPYGTQLLLETEDVGGDLLNLQFIEKIEEADVDKVGNESFYLFTAQRMKSMFKINETLIYSTEDPLLNITINPSEINIHPLVPTFSKIIKTAKDHEVDLIIMTGGTSHFPLVREYFTSEDIGINVSFIPNGMVTQSTAITNGRIRGINYFANCQTFLEIHYKPENEENNENEENEVIADENEQKNVKKYQLSDLQTLSNETLEFNLSVEELMKIENFKILENDHVLTQFHVNIPPIAKNDENLELIFGFDIFSEPDILSVKYDGFPCDIGVERPPWMFTEEEYENATEFINAFDVVISERAKQLRIMRERKQKIIQFLKSQHKFNKTAFKEANLTREEFYERLKKRFEEHKEKEMEQNNTEKENTTNIISEESDDPKKIEL